VLLGASATPPSELVDMTGRVIGALGVTSARPVALLDTGAIPGGDMTFEAALTKLMVLVDRHEPDDVRQLMQQDLAVELTAPTP
jgi:L-asparaginase/Glu-tRNA(Gln) amidotransferase subunit D